MKVLKNVCLYFEPVVNDSTLNRVTVQYQVFDGDFSKSVNRTFELTFDGIESSEDLYNSVIEEIKNDEGIQ